MLKLNRNTTYVYFDDPLIRFGVDGHYGKTGKEVRFYAIDGLASIICAETLFKDALHQRKYFCALVKACYKAFAIHTEHTEFPIEY
jgi:hypothetical protein